MRTLLYGRAPAVFFTLLIGSFAGAQTNPNPNTYPSNPNTNPSPRDTTNINRQNANENAPQVGRVRLGLSVEETDLVANGYRGSKILHESVYNDKNEKVGRVEDIILSPEGQLSAAIVEVGGFLGMGRHLVAIPVRQFTEFTPHLVLPGATKDALKSMPPFEYTNKRK